jgi:hypothetical protein
LLTIKRISNTINVKQAAIATIVITAARNAALGPALQVPIKKFIYLKKTILFSFYLPATINAIE